MRQHAATLAAGGSAAGDPDSGGALTRVINWLAPDKATENP